MKPQNFSILKHCTSHSYLQTKCSLTKVKIGSRIWHFLIAFCSNVEGEERREEMREIFQDMLLESSYIYLKATLIFKLKIFYLLQENWI